MEQGEELVEIPLRLEVVGGWMERLAHSLKAQQQVVGDDQQRRRPDLARRGQQHGEEGVEHHLYRQRPSRRVPGRGHRRPEGLQ